MKPTGLASTDLGNIYHLTAVTPGCRQHVGFHAHSDEAAIKEASFLRAYHAQSAFDPQCRDAWLNGSMTLVSNDRVITTDIPMEDLGA
jgi:hypothetical protein